MQLEPWESPACLWTEQEHKAAAMTEAGVYDYKGADEQISR